MSTAPSVPAPAELKRRALLVLFWFVAVSLAFNALFGDMGLVQGLRQRHLAAMLQREVASLRQDNDALMAEVKALRHDPSRIEAIAREDLGLSRPGEIIFLFKDPDAPATPARPTRR